MKKNSKKIETKTNKKTSQSSSDLEKWKEYLDKTWPRGIDPAGIN